MDNHKFWNALDRLLNETEIVIDKPKGTIKDDLIYPVDYGCLKGTKSSDYEGIDVYVGSMENPLIDAVICTVNLYKKESEVKILFGCDEKEKEAVYHIYFGSRETLHGILIRRN